MFVRCHQKHIFTVTPTSKGALLFLLGSLLIYCYLEKGKVKSGCGIGAFDVHGLMDFLLLLEELLCLMQPGDYHLENSWNSAFQTMQPQAELLVVDILYTRIVLDSTGIHLNFNPIKLSFE